MAKLPHTAKALAEYDAKKACLDKEFNEWLEKPAVTGHLLDIINQTEELLTPLREAFYEDTKHINSHDKCMLVDVATLRKWVEKFGD